ncbi:MAG: LPP20 family lipoprotein [Marinifilaceae bacterium]
MMFGFLYLSKKSMPSGNFFSLALCLILFFSFQAGAQNRPGWASGRPINTMYYIGIGYASKSETDYMKVAKQKALSDLISEIEVKVASNSLLNSLDDNGKISSYFKENIQLEAQKTIEDYQLVESWENDQEYWVYYQLNKYDYKEKERLRLEQIQEKAFDHLEKARSHKLSGNLSGALFNYIEGLKLIQNDLNRNLPFQKNGAKYYLGNELYQGLAGVFEGVQIVTDPKIVYGQMFQAVKDVIWVRVRRGENAVTNLPLKFQFTSGSGDVNSGVLTNDKGDASLQILNVTSKQARQLIRISPDLDRLCSGDRNELVRRLSENIQSVPEVQLELRLESPTLKAYLKQGAQSNSSLLKSLKRVLTNNYFNFVPNEEMADIIVDLNEEFRKGERIPGEMYNMNEYFSSVSLQITSKKSQETVFDYSVNDMRSLAPESTSMSAARMSASRNILKKIKRKLIQELKKLQLTAKPAHVAAEHQ